MAHSQDSKGSMFWTAVMGAAAGAAAVILTDKNKRRELKTKMDSWLGEAQELKEKGKEKLESEMDKTKAKVRKLAA